MPSIFLVRSKRNIEKPSNFDMSFNFKYNYPQIARDTGFTLRQLKDGPLDWRTVASLEVEKIIREQQFESIDSILFYLSEAPIAPMLESNILDSGIAKYFTLSQLAIQYLLFCRKFLDETVCTLREKLTEIEAENMNLKTINREHSNEIICLHKKISQMEAINDIVYPCYMCTKNFVSNDALNMHLSKKHSNLVPDGLVKDNDKSLINTIKLELEIKQLKERLNSAEKEIRESIARKNQITPSKNEMKNSSTQVYIQINDVATQSNLTETKESDSAMDDFARKEALGGLQKNIANLEHRQEKQFEDNQSSIQNINQMLKEIMNVLHSKCNPDQEALRKLVENQISASVQCTSDYPKEIKSILIKSVSEIVNLNTEKLNEILLNIENICHDMLPSLKAEIQKGREFEQDHVQFPQQEKEDNIDFEKGIYKEKELSDVVYQSTHIDVTNSEMLLYNQSGTDNTEASEKQFNFHENDRQQRKSRTSIEAIQPVLNIERTRKMFEKSMLHLGIKPDEITLSTSEANKISSNLDENRISSKRIYPRFYATRNKLKNLVEELTNKKMNNVPHHSAFSNIITARTSKTHKQHPSESKDAINEVVLRNKIEEILNSPVKSPKTLPKPVPLPRKRVMFHNIDN